MQLVRCISVASKVSKQLFYILVCDFIEHTSEGDKEQSVQAADWIPERITRLSQPGTRASRGAESCSQSCRAGTQEAPLVSLIAAKKEKRVGGQTDTEIRV